MLCKLKKTIELEKQFQCIFREYETNSRFNGMYRIDVDGGDFFIITKFEMQHLIFTTVL